MEVGQVEAWGKLQVFHLEAGLGRNGDSWLHGCIHGCLGEVDVQWQVQGRFDMQEQVGGGVLALGVPPGLGGNGGSGQF